MSEVHGMEDQGNYVGKSIGNYHIVTLIGSGGFGSVYQGEHSILKERVVAIKILHNHLGSPAERDRFLEEARLLGHIQHHNILQIFDAGIDSGLPYLVTEYAPHGSLRDLLKRDAHTILPEDVSLRILSQVGEALSYAHEQHIIHRDLKPENILFNANDVALLADFGIAITLSTSSVKYSSVMGTPAYMAPEQFQGILSQQGDQYALGCIAYELMTGQQPFTAPDFIAMGFKHVSEQPIPPAQLNPALPMHIEQAILKAMAKQRGERHADVGAFLAALEGSQHSQSSLSTDNLPGFSNAHVHVTTGDLTTMPASHLSQAATFVQVNTTNPDQDGTHYLSQQLSTPLQNFEERQRGETGGILPTQQVSPPLEYEWNGGPPYQPYQPQQRDSGRRRIFLAFTCAFIAIAIIAPLLFVGLPNFLHANASTQKVNGTVTTTQAQSTSTVTAHVKPISGKPTHLITTPGSTLRPTPTTPSNPTATPTAHPPTPTPTPILSVMPIDDSVTGTGQNQWNYVGSGWKSCTNCNETNPTVIFYDTSQHWDKTTNDTVTLIFSGTQIKFYGVTASWEGIGAVSIDGGVETDVDFYSVNKTGDVLLWTSPVLANGIHTFKLRVAADTYIAVDRAEILASS
jgi:serine/threonine protein kinase